MQALLPDVNVALTAHRAAALTAYDRRDPIKAAMQINLMIAVLPDDYKPIIDTDEYTRRASTRRLVVCKICQDNYNPPKITKTDNPEMAQQQAAEQKPYEFEAGTIRPYELLLSSIDAFILDQKSLIVWDCPRCGNTSPFETTMKINEEQVQPVYFGVMPAPPNREGFHDRVGYESRFWKWFDIAFSELNNKIGLYRAEYTRQQNAIGAEVTPFIKDEAGG